MRTKLIAIAALFALATSVQAATLSTPTIQVLQGSGPVDVPVTISTSTVPPEEISAINLSFSVGAAGDAIPITNDAVNAAFWGANIAASAPPVPTPHNIFTGISQAAAPFGIEANGLIITYTIDPSALPQGMYAFNTNFDNRSSAATIDQAGGQVLVDLEHMNGVLHVIPEPSTVVLAAIFGLVGIVTVIRRRR